MTPTTPERHRELSRAWKDRHQEQQREYAWRRRQEKRDYANAQKQACVDCGWAGSPVGLHFDHTNGDKSSTVARLIDANASFDRIQSEIDKCEVRCANCHAIRHHNAHRPAYERLASPGLGAERARLLLESRARQLGRGEPDAEGSGRPAEDLS